MPARYVHILETTQAGLNIAEELMNIISKILLVLGK